MLFDQVIESKQLVIVLSNEGKPSISYKSDNVYQVYHINGLEIFKNLLDNLILQNPIVIIRYDSNLSFLAMISYFNSIEDDQKRSHIKDEFLHQYKVHNKDQPSIGQCDFPLVCRIIISISQLDPTHLESIKLQQFLRFLALLHGGSFMVLQDINLLMSNLLNESEIVNPVFTNNDVCLSIPRGWDSWNRIQILSKSIYDQNDLLATDEDMISLQNKYREFLNGNNKGLYEFLNIRPKAKNEDPYSPLKFSDIVEAIN